MKKVLITGANQGIGWEVAKLLAQENYYVYLACRRQEAGLEAVSKLNELGYQHAKWVQLDVTEEKQIQTAMTTLSNEVDCLDALINSAGILGVHDENREVSISEIQHVFDTNLFGVMRVTRAFLPLLHKASEPRIVNVSSGLASLTCHSDPNWKYAQYKSDAYFPSKAALNAYTIALSAKFHSAGFKINAVDPGYSKTAFNNYQGDLDPAVAAQIVVRAATFDTDGPTGCFLSDSEGSEEGIMPW